MKCKLMEEGKVKIKVVKKYIAMNESGESALTLGGYVRLVFLDGTYQSGDLEKITETHITISRGDGEYTYSTTELMAINT